MTETRTRRTRDGTRLDLVTSGAALGLVAVAALVGGALYLAGRPVQASSAPFTAHWVPHVGPGTVPALAVAALVVCHGARLAGTLSWRALLAAGYGTAVAWILSLALVDGWQRGLAGRLTTKDEYLSEVGGVTDLAAMVDGFAGRILAYQPDSWTTHVSGHPPGAFLVFLGLDRIGLGGGAWAALVCVAAGALTAVAVPVTIRALGDEDAARAAVPFLVLFPGAIWLGVSADGLFAGVAATGVALLAVAVTRRRLWAGAAAGVLLAFCVYLSYGLTLLALPVLAVLLLARRSAPLPWRTVGVAAVSGGVVVAAFTLAGFWWFDGYHLVVERYYQGVATDRPYAYWVWANLALVVACAGPAAAVVLRRALPAFRSGPAAVLALAGLAAILFADLSGLSKAEVERIWLPFAVWLLAGAALLPSRTRRYWLVTQALTALLINHLLLTSW
jgi:methylthioxylose transferase